MVIFHSYVSLPEGNPLKHVFFFFNFARPFPRLRRAQGISQLVGTLHDALSGFLQSRLGSVYSYGHLPVITGYKWDYTFYKWGYKYL